MQKPSLDLEPHFDYLAETVKNWQTFKNGWPDRLVRRDDGVLFCVDIKRLDKYGDHMYRCDPIRPAQLRMFKLLDEIGLTTMISINGSPDRLVSPYVWSEKPCFDKQGRIRLAEWMKKERL